MNQLQIYKLFLTSPGVWSGQRVALAFDPPPLALGPPGRRAVRRCGRRWRQSSLCGSSQMNRSGRVTHSTPLHTLHVETEQLLLQPTPTVRPLLPTAQRPPRAMWLLREGGSENPRVSAVLVDTAWVYLELLPVPLPLSGGGNLPFLGNRVGV